MYKKRLRYEPKIRVKLAASLKGVCEQYTHWSKGSVNTDIYLNQLVKSRSILFIVVMTISYSDPSLHMGITQKC